MSLNTLKARLRYAGGDNQSRIRQERLRTLQCALENDYNSRLIETEHGKVCKAILNKKTISADYDKETIDVEYTSNLHEGDTFRIIDNNYHYMIYLPNFIEVAYLNAEILRCKYTIDIDGKTYWVYFKGPTQSNIAWSGSDFKYNKPNLAGTIYIKNDEHTKEFFKRFTRIKIAGKPWEVQATDSISVSGIIEVAIKEDFENVAEELPEIIKEPDILLNGDEIIPNRIIGKTEVKPGDIVGYSILEPDYNSSLSWRVNGSAAILETFDDNKICKVKVLDTSDNFTIAYGDITLQVFVNDAKPEIVGDAEVYPYSIHEYKIDGVCGEFLIDTDLARIVEKMTNRCKIEILTGKKGKFTLSYYEDNTDNVYELPIKIKSM